MKVLYTGETNDPLIVEFVSDPPVTLGAQAVRLGFGSTPAAAAWTTAAWIGSSGTTRECQITISGANLPPVGASSVWIDVAGNYERAGSVYVV